MTAYAVFLRGVNIGGVNIKMADMRQALAALRVEHVRTILASGNVLLESDLDPTVLTATVQTTLRASFGYDAWVIVLPVARVAELVAACPYSASDPLTHAYVTLSSDPAALEALLEVAHATAASGGERLGPEAMAWTAPVGETLESPVTKALASARYKRTTTTRNLRTLAKVAAG